MSARGEGRSGPACDGVVGFATALLTALRTVSMYPAAHPRVAAAVAGFLTTLREQTDGQRWVTLRLRGTQLGIDDVWVEADEPQLGWLCDRLRGASMCGIEFGAKCTDADVVEFARVLAPGVARAGQAPAPAWPTGHPRLRTLELVYSGHHSEGGSATAGTASGVASGQRSSEAEARRRGLLASLAGSEALRARLSSIESGCRGHELEEAVEVDLLEAVADLLPAEIVGDAAATIELTGEILDRVYEEVLRASSTGGVLPRNELLSSALEVAKRFLTAAAPARVQRGDLPTGRPEDARIEDSLELLLHEYACLPDWTDDPLVETSAERITGLSLDVDLLGIHLHTLATAGPAERGGTPSAKLADLLGTLDSERLAVLDAYLRPDAPGKPTRIGDAATLKLLTILTRLGRRPLILQRGYCPAALVQRGFPESLSIGARILGGTPRGLAVLREALVLLQPSLSGVAVEAAAAAGILAETDVLRALVAIGGELPLPLLAAAAASAHGEALDRLLDYARALPLPEAEAAVLHWLKPADLPAHYLTRLLRAASNRSFDASLRALSVKALCDFIDRGRGTLPLDHLLGAMHSLREMPSTATLAFLRRLATEGRFTRWSAADRAVRQNARQLLATPGLFGSGST